MQVLLFLILLFPSITLAQSDDYFTLSHDKKCYVKSYHKTHFTSVDPKKFQKLRIFAKPHKKNNRYSLFKHKNQIYVTLTSCLDPIDVESADLDHFIDSAPTEDDKYVNKASNSTPFAEGLRFDENNYFLELNVGSTTISDENQIFPDYGEFNGVEDTSGNPITFDKAEKAKYKANGAVSFGAGWRWTEGSFLTLKFKHFSGKKTEVVTATSALGTGSVDFEYKDTFTSILIGNKFIFFPNSHLKPTFGLYVGLNSIQLEMTISDETKLKLESRGISALAEVGLEYLFTTNFGLGVTAGYEYLGSRKFKLKDKDDSVTDTGFTSKLSYSNTFILGGLKVYFK